MCEALEKAFIMQLNGMPTKVVLELQQSMYIGLMGLIVDKLPVCPRNLNLWQQYIHLLFEHIIMVFFKLLVAYIDHHIGLFLST